MTGRDAHSGVHGGDNGEAPSGLRARLCGPTSGINKQVDDPFYGFNAGSTHVRVGGDGDPIFYQFEGPLLRLILDEDYVASSAR